jgi:hypothetical protein
VACGQLLPAELRAPAAPPPPSHGAFRSKDYHRFQVVDNAFGAPGLRNELSEYEFDQILIRSGQLPNLGSAPFASWMLARIATLTSGILVFPINGKQRNDGGGYVIDFLVYNKNERPIAEFQLQGDTMGAGVLGRRTEDCSSDDVVQALASILLEQPMDLTVCRLSIVDPEWREDPSMYIPKPKRGSKNLYGWDGKKFLGEDNIKDMPL